MGYNIGGSSHISPLMGHSERTKIMKRNGKKGANAASSAITAAIGAGTATAVAQGNQSKRPDFVRVIEVRLAHM